MEFGGSPDLVSRWDFKPSLDPLEEENFHPADSEKCRGFLPDGETVTETVLEYAERIEESLGDAEVEGEVDYYVSDFDESLNELEKEFSSERAVGRMIESLGTDRYETAEAMKEELEEAISGYADGDGFRSETGGPAEIREALEDGGTVLGAEFRFRTGDGGVRLSFDTRKMSFEGSTSNYGRGGNPGKPFRVEAYGDAGEDLKEIDDIRENRRLREKIEDRFRSYLT